VEAYQGFLFYETFKNIFSKIKIDTFTTILTFSILLFGFAIFFSASLGVMARYETKFYNVVQNQFLFGVILGSIAFFLGALPPMKFFKSLSPLLYITGFLLCILVFVPGIGFEHGGARRWIELAGFTFQPSEILKYSSVLLLSAFYSFFHENFSDWKYRVLPALTLATFVLVVLKEPDLGTSTIILAGIFGVFFLVNAKAKDILIILLFSIPLFTGFYMYYPHAKERVNTWIFPEKNSSDQNYQANQTKISLGAGGLWGDGYGKSTQKFHNLPEPIGDSIFAVIGEEFGFAGSVLVLLIIIILAYRLIYLSTFFRDPYHKGVLSGTGIILLTQTFLNAGSASGAIPFTGVPLPLISHGSTSIIITMGMLGLCAKISTRKYLH
jgi:cell division protein FtsW